MIQLNHNTLSAIITHALEEDIGTGDITSNALVPSHIDAQFKLIAVEPMVICGLEIVNLTLKQFDTPYQITAPHKDGDRVSPGTILLEGSGKARTLLTAERVMLNLIQAASGVATTTQLYAQAIAHTKAKLLDTRKTLPGLRMLQKYAVTVGGGYNHRLRLDDGVMIKDNHIAIHGDIRTASEIVRNSVDPTIKIEVECDTLEQVEEAISCSSVDIILLDNMPPETLKQAVKLNQGQKILEASGGVSLETIQAIAETGVDYISVGKLTRELKSADISMQICL